MELQTLGYTATTFTIQCEDGKSRTLDGFIADGTGLGYYIYPPVPGAPPEYVFTSNGIATCNHVNWYVIKHVASNMSISNHTLFDEDEARRAIVEIATLTDWNASRDELCKQRDLVVRMEEVFKQMNEAKHKHAVCWIGGAFYCIDCSFGFSEEEAREALAKKEALASCETCGKGFDPESGMFELGEYSYCGDCNTW